MGSLAKVLKSLKKKEKKLPKEVLERQSKKYAECIEMLRAQEILKMQEEDAARPKKKKGITFDIESTTYATWSGTELGNYTLNYQTIQNTAIRAAQNAGVSPTYYATPVDPQPGVPVPATPTPPRTRSQNYIDQQYEELVANQMASPVWTVTTNHLNELAQNGEMVDPGAGWLTDDEGE